MTSQAPRTCSSRIPLHCNICPDQPDFSDVSHLLTHIASKGHLSTYYKIKVRAGNEYASRRLIEDYDTWYAANGIEDLMSERLNLKERPVPVANAIETQSVGTFGIPRGYEYAVDPRLVPHAVKTEPPSGNSTPSAASFVDPTSLHQLYTPYQICPVMPYAHMLSRLEEDDRLSTDQATRRVAQTGGRDASPVFTEFDADDANDASKLKGVFWPGMDMFDAAPPEQRRKRNQKKDTSVVKHLEAMSQTIESNEMVFSPAGSLRKVRDISGLPNLDSSPIPGEETPPRPQKAKRAPRRKPLTEKNPNTAEAAAQKVPKKKGRPRKSNAVRAQEVQDLQRDSGSGTPNVTRRRTRARRAPLHADDGGEATFDRPATMTYLTSGRRQMGVFQSPESRSAVAPQSGMDDMVYAPPQGYYYQPHYAANPFSLESSMLPPWDQYAHDASSSMTNPLFGGLERGDMDDDQATISAPSSDD